MQYVMYDIMYNMYIHICLYRYSLHIIIYAYIHAYMTYIHTFVRITLYTEDMYVLTFELKTRAEFANYIHAWTCQTQIPRKGSLNGSALSQQKGAIRSISKKPRGPYPKAPKWFLLGVHI